APVSYGQRSHPGTATNRRRASPYCLNLHQRSLEPICARMAARWSVEAVADCCRRRGTPALRRLAGKKLCQQRASRKCGGIAQHFAPCALLSKNLGLIFVWLSNVDYSPSSPTLVAVNISSIHTF